MTRAEAFLAAAQATWGVWAFLALLAVVGLGLCRVGRGWVE